MIACRTPDLDEEVIRLLLTRGADFTLEDEVRIHIHIHKVLTSQAIFRMAILSNRLWKTKKSKSTPRLKMGSTAIQIILLSNKFKYNINYLLFYL